VYDSRQWVLLVAQVKLFAQNSGSASSWRLSAESNGGANPASGTGALLTAPAPAAAATAACMKQRSLHTRQQTSIISAAQVFSLLYGFPPIYTVIMLVLLAFAPCLIVAV
jgi:hypothetical protein